MRAALLQPPMYYGGDDCNRSNGAIGSSYTTDSSSPLVINTNRLQITPQGMGAGATVYINTWRGGGNDGKVFTDCHEIRAQLTPSGYALATNNPFMLFIAGSDTTYSSGINVLFAGHSGGSTACIIQTGSGSTYTTRASTSTQIATNALVQFRRIGNVFSVLVNGSAFLSWTDTGGIVPTGTGQRRVRVGLTGNYPTFQQQFQCASIDAWSAYDLAA